ncbi:MAG: hypothetical protein AB7P52_17705 [Alphaproteobacteria bacterium]
MTRQVRRPVSPEPLPKLLDRVAAIAGQGAALALARAYGGTEIYVPSTLPPGHELEAVLGRPAAELVIGEIGGGWRLIPLGPFTTHARQGRLILARLRDGAPAADIAREANVHVRTVKRYRARLRHSR